TTREIEVVISQLWPLNEAKTTPFPIEDETNTSEDLRLKYRYLDLRRPKMQDTFRTRHRITMVVRDYMDRQGFWEIETPILTKSTPECARGSVHHDRGNDERSVRAQGNRYPGAAASNELSGSDGPVRQRQARHAL